jgi:hypothetical protein
MERLTIKIEEAAALRQHGSDAEIEAARLQDLTVYRGDDEGRWVWRRISG